MPLAYLSAGTYSRPTNRKCQIRPAVRFFICTSALQPCPETGSHACNAGKHPRRFYPTGLAALIFLFLMSLNPPFPISAYCLLLSSHCILPPKACTLHFAFVKMVFLARLEEKPRRGSVLEVTSELKIDVGMPTPLFDRLV